MIRLFAMTLLSSVCSSAFAQASDPYAWQGPYPFGLTESEIDGIVDHMYVLQFPAGNPATGVTAGERQYVKFQLTGPGFECWKYSTLCEWVGKAKAGQFLGDYVSLLRRLPTQEEYDFYTQELLTYYENVGQATSGTYVLNPSEVALWTGSIQHFFGIETSASAERSQTTTPDSANDGTVSLTQGRARYVIGGHNWARGEAVPKDGATVRVQATFQNTNGDGSVRIEVQRDRSGPNKVVVTGPYADGYWPQPPWHFKTVLATATAHGDVATGSACFVAVPRVGAPGCQGVSP